MPLPEYIATRTISVGGAATIESNRLLKIRATLSATKSLIWDDTGFQFLQWEDKKTSTLGSQVTFTPPRTDLQGWKDFDSKALIDTSAEGSFSHQYILLVEYLDENDAAIGIAPTVLGPFVVPDGVGELDLDTTVVVGTVAGDQVSIPDSWDAKVAAAEAAALAAAASLADLDATTADNITTPGTDTELALSATIAEGVGSVGGGLFVGKDRLNVAARTNLCSDPDYDNPTRWVNSYSTGTPTVTQDTYTFSDGTTRKGAKVSFATTQAAAAGAIRAGRTNANDIIVTGGQPLTVQLRAVSSIVQTLYMTVVEYANPAVLGQYKRSQWITLPAGGDGAVFSVSIPALAANTVRVQVQLWSSRGVPFTAGSWLFVTGVTVEQSANARGPIFSGNDDDAVWAGAVGASNSTVALSNPVKEFSSRLYGAPTVSGDTVPVLRRGVSPSWLTDAAWEPSRTEFAEPSRPWTPVAPNEGWPNGNLAFDDRYIFQAYHTLVQVGTPPRGMTVRVRRQRLGSRTTFDEQTVWDTTGSGYDADVNAAFVAPNGDWCIILREGTDTFPIPAPTLTGNYLLRSTDHGDTWDSGTEVLNASAAPINMTSISAPFVTQAGTTLSTGIKNTAGDTYLHVLRNTTADLTGGWTTNKILGIAISSLEGNYVQFASGLIACFIRLNNTAWVTTSTDDGVTWTNAYDTNLKLISSPATIIYDPTSDTAEIFSGDRFESAIWSVVATEDHVTSGVFPTQRVVVRGNSEAWNGNFGYPAAILLPDRRVLLRYMDYNIPATSAAIWEAWGRKI